MYIDAHTHQQYPHHPSVYSIYNQPLQTPIAPNQPLSVGIHPWYIQSTAIQQQLNTLETLLYQQHPNIVAIGECGLDKQIPTPFNIQQQVFIAHIHLANQLQRPLIIHCVRAWSELVVCLTQHKAQVPVIIHGFNQRPTIANLLLAKGYTLSLGAALLHPASNARALLPTLSSTAFLLETDNTPLHIQQIYTHAAQIRQTDIHTLCHQLHTHASHIGLVPPAINP